jgi:hypothetical protein
MRARFLFEAATVTVEHLSYVADRRWRMRMLMRRGIEMRMTELMLNSTRDFGGSVGSPSCMTGVRRHVYVVCCPHSTRRLRAPHSTLAPPRDIPFLPPSLARFACRPPCFAASRSRTVLARHAHPRTHLGVAGTLISGRAN